MLLWLLLLAGAMFMGSFLAGLVPLSFQLSEDRLRVMSTFAAGLMVGTALIVILPEGVETLYSVQYASCSGAVPATTHGIHHRRAVDVVDVAMDAVHNAFLRSRATAFSLVATAEVAAEVSTKVSISDGAEGGAKRRPNTRRADADTAKDAASPSRESASSAKAKSAAAKDAETPADKEMGSPHSPLEGGDATDGKEPFAAHLYIGPSLALGFGAMFLIDQLFQTHPHSGSHTHIVALTDFRGLPSTPSRTEVPAVGKSIAATIGLVVHAAADGIALGAASASNRASLELLVFLAIMLHKAPSAFGLATFLLDSGHSRKTVRQHLLAFSCSAPLGAVATYAALQSSQAAGGPGAAADLNKWTGILLLFSAGTFLFVSTVHILPEVINRPHGSGHGDIMNGNALDRGPAAKGAKESQTSRKMTFLQVVVVMLGLCSPYFLTVSHGHGGH
ncbi:Zinc/iron permease [Hyaloraphidium curvatum]|nr:Zinc/iron permease [Hyaloraphidium curvatum]